MTCKDCVHYDICLDNGDDAAKQNAEHAEEECDFFKNKADFVEVVRCKNCIYYGSYEEFDRHCGEIFVCYECEELHRNFGDNGFCSRGVRRST